MPWVTLESPSAPSGLFDQSVLTSPTQVLRRGLPLMPFLLTVSQHSSFGHRTMTCHLSDSAGSVSEPLLYERVARLGALGESFGMYGVSLN